MLNPPPDPPLVHHSAEEVNIWSGAQTDHRFQNGFCCELLQGGYHHICFTVPQQIPPVMSREWIEIPPVMSREYDRISRRFVPTHYRRNPPHHMILTKKCVFPTKWVRNVWKTYHSQKWWMNHVWTVDLCDSTVKQRWTMVDWIRKRVSKWSDRDFLDSLLFESFAFREKGDGRRQTAVDCLQTSLKMKWWMNGGLVPNES